MTTLTSEVERLEKMHELARMMGKLGEPVYPFSRKVDGHLEIVFNDRTFLDWDSALSYMRRTVAELLQHRVDLS